MIKNDIKYTSLLTNCNQFIIESCGLPLFKHLKYIDYKEFSKIKVRYKKSIDPIFSEAYSEAFDVNLMYSRTMFAHGELTYKNPVSALWKTYFVFPSNGYEYIYNTEVQNSSIDYKDVFEKIVSYDGDKNLELIKEILKFQYKHSDLEEGIKSGAEIMFYNTPYYYVINKDTIIEEFESYDNFWNEMVNDLGL